MTPKSDNPNKKGFFSDVRLPVAKRYVYPSARTRMYLIGGVGAVVIAVLFVVLTLLLWEAGARGFSAYYLNLESDDLPLLLSWMKWRSM